MMNDVDGIETTPQWKTALQAANAVRTARARYKEALSAREVSAEQLLHDPPSFAEDATVFEVLQWLPGIGRSRALNIMRATGTSTTLLLRHVQTSKRDFILEQVRHRQSDRDQQLQAA